MMPALLILAALIRLPLLTANMWYDENYTVILARLPFMEMITATAGDVHPPLWYVVEWLLYRIPGLPTWAIRLPAFALSIVAVWLFAKLLPKLEMPESARVIALSMFVIAPMQIQYSIEGRMYALLVTLVLLGALFVLDRKPWHLLAVLIALSYTHNWGLLYAAALGLWLFFVTVQDERRKTNDQPVPFVLRPSSLVILVGILTFLAWLPWAGVMLNQLGMIQGMYWITRITLGQVMYQVYQHFAGSFFPHPSAMIAFYTLLIAGLVLSIYTRRWFILWMAAAPMLLAVAISLVAQPIMLYRAMIGAAPFTYLLIAAPIAALWERNNWQRVMLVLFLLPVVSAYAPLYDHASKYGYQDEMQVIAAHARPGDVIVAPGDTGVVNLLPYMTQPIYLLEECQPSRGALTWQTRTAMGYTTIAAESLEMIDGRIFLIWGRHPLMDACEIEMVENLIATANAETLFFEEDFPGMMERGVYLLGVQ